MTGIEFWTPQMKARVEATIELLRGAAEQYHTFKTTYEDFPEEYKKATEMYFRLLRAFYLQSAIEKRLLMMSLNLNDVNEIDEMHIVYGIDETKMICDNMYGAMTCINEIIKKMNKHE